MHDLIIAPLPPSFVNHFRTFEQTINFIEKVATTKIHEDIANLIAELGIQLRELELERKEDHKIVKLHPFEVASLANLIKAVSSISLMSYNPHMNSFIFKYSAAINMYYYIITHTYRRKPQ